MAIEAKYKLRGTLNMRHQDTIIIPPPNIDRVGGATIIIISRCNPLSIGAVGTHLLQDIVSSPQH